MLLRRIALLSSAAVMAGAALSASTHAGAADDACRSTSPNASACIGADKVAEAAMAACRQAGGPDGTCTLPLGRDVSPSRLAAYRSSWTHRAAAFQFALGDTVPLRDAQWLGTHNSFNTDSNGVTLSHTDSNQQLTLTQQLDGDVRALELDVHYVPSAERAGAKGVVVCHGRGPDQMHAGCTSEPLLSTVLPEIRTWLDRNPSQVILLYLEDELGDAAGYAETVDALNSVLGARIYRPAPGAATCRDLPLDTSRADVRAAGAQVILVGNCRTGWASDVFGWDSNHVESGSTPGYRPFPACDATYGAGVYDAKLVRYFEDSTWLSAAVDPSQTPADHDASSLSPDKVAAMTRCGVNLFGLDQFDPADGRVDASIWSLAPGEQPPAPGACVLQGGDGRWRSLACALRRPAACQAADGRWIVTADAVAGTEAAVTCSAHGARQALPRTGLENSQLRAAAGDRDVWLANPAA